MLLKLHSRASCLSLQCGLAGCPVSWGGVQSAVHYLMQSEMPAYPGWKRVVVVPSHRVGSLRTVRGACSGTEALL